MSGRWRVGTKVPRNLYRDDVEVGVMVGPLDEAAELAAVIAQRMNELDVEGPAETSDVRGINEGDPGGG